MSSIPGIQPPVAAPVPVSRTVDSDGDHDGSTAPAPKVVVPQPRIANPTPTMGNHVNTTA